MRVVGRIGPGRRWRPGRTVFQQGAVIQAHLDFMRARFDDHSLLIGGPFANGMSGLAVLEVADLTAARELAEADPAAAAGVLVYELDELVPYFDAVSGVRVGSPAVRPRTERLSDS